MQNLYIALNILLCLVVIIALPAATPKRFKNTASYALGGFANLDGWPNGYAFILSFLAPLWTIGAYDSSVHISEEATNARTAVPFAIITSIGTAAILGWAINVSLAFNMGTDLDSIVSNPIGQPMATIFFNSFGQKATLVLWSFIIIVQFMMGSSILLASSRQTFAFARDGGLPFSSLVYRVNKHTKTPVNGVWMAALVAFLLGLFAFAGSAAINAIFALGVTGQNVAYSIPIAARFIFNNDFHPGPFSLGKFSLPIGVVAVVWMMFNSIVVIFPSTPDPTPATMNYTVVVLGGTLILALVYYYFPKYGGVYWFRGPVQNISVSSSEYTLDKKVEKEDADEKGSTGADEIHVVQ